MPAISQKALMAFLESPDAPTIINMLGKMTPEQRERVPSILAAHAGRVTYNPIPLKPPTRTQKVREKANHVRAVLRKHQAEVA